ncbi:putative nucleotidyltransferase with HDIG domain [Bacillus mesophilus]|uniref:HD-GYP domain-containing protein n=1 Tax=Bacillus mesophilus TaxID=1808955 RepID=A0A6M0Q7B5_9BACI|nr:HD-GYP domain-containing protein [Bacillus mesophilus]MBM7661556.1 putative nucleotidyltransferase with HDIG domain [Bacillus mesophilus]NEY72225.1 HD-GYP domain-containing protein [Bacillus mesophilus]
MELRAEKILKILWITCIMGALILHSIYLLFRDGFSPIYFLLLSILLLGFLPYTLLHRFIGKKCRADLLFINACLVTTAISLSLPFYNYFLMIFLPLISILFNQRRFFYIGSAVTIGVTIYELFFKNYLEEISTLQASIDIAFLFAYLFILDFVVRANAQYTKTSYIYDKTLNTLILAVEAKDDYTRGHSIRVSDYAMILGQYMCDTGYKIDLESLRISSILHDIGKINIPQDILSKEGKLTFEEYNTIKKHSQYGADLAKELGYPSHIVESILSHHERFDGKGYPEGKADQDTPINAKIIAIADTFDALTSNRSYRKAFSADEARKIVLDSMGSQFNANFEPVFEAVYPKFVEYQANVKNGNQEFSKVV